MNETKHKLKVSVGNLKVELVGSEEFVKKYEEKFSLEEKVRELVDKNKPANNGTQESPQNNQTTNEANNQGETQYPNVFDQGGKIKESIFNVISRYSAYKADKQRKIALLHLLGMELRTSRKAETTTGEIRDIYYKKYGRPKSMNLKKNLRNSYFEIIGEKRSKNSPIKLTPAGRDRAKELAKRLNDELSEQSANNT